MDDLLALAGRLGELIAENQRFRGLRAAEDAVEADASARALLQSYDRQRRKIAELEAELKPVEPEDKRELQRLADATHSNPKLQALLRCQADYLEMMNRVNSAIRDKLGAPAQKDKGTP